jgi:deoxyribodipyrimidine photo-lyase
MQEAMATGEVSSDNGSKFLAEIGWREFSRYLLFYFPSIESEPFNDKFEDFPWQSPESHLTAWQQGKTGYPIVDAGMRELWQTGYMHNRVRMICASFLTKHLLIHWQNGADWFWDTLVDADLANNTASWQWVAGCGADAAPYFRIFNPVLQGEKFDKQGDYVRRWVPELANLPDKYLHQPWAAKQDVLMDANVVLGKDYPKPIVDHATARQAALDAYEQIKSS